MRDEEQLRRAIGALLDIGKLVLGKADESDLLRLICRVVVEASGYRMAWIGYRENDAARSLRPVAHAGVDEGYLSSINVSYGETGGPRIPAGAAIGTGRVSLVRNLQADPGYAPWRRSPCSPR